MSDRITFRRPDDWHVHVRDGAMMSAVVAASARDFGRAIIMPNLKPPITTTAAAEAYRGRIRAALPAGARFEPLMTLYLTDHTNADDLVQGHRAGIVTAAKLYPQGATTNSDSGVTDWHKIWRVLEAMESHGIPLLVHGEVTNPAVDVFDREAVFLETVLEPMMRRLPGLKVVLEHVTTRQGVDFVRAHSGRTGATITPHHLVLNRNALFEGGLRPHMYCLPVAKRESHRQALIEAATSGEAQFFLGTDSAPHARAAKEADCGCAGIFNAPTAVAVYLKVFETTQRLGQESWRDRFERFASLNGPAFYGLAPSDELVTWVKGNAIAPGAVPADGGDVVVFRGGEDLEWHELTSFGGAI